uniref:Uncharacterized protein n=1 Tax=Amphimedon queenslandica TaxID=400682 RepID=A0A1X7UQ49_AMPQE
MPQIKYKQYLSNLAVAIPKTTAFKQKGNETNRPKLDHSQKSEAEAADHDPVTRRKLPDFTVPINDISRINKRGDITGVNENYDKRGDTSETNDMDSNETVESDINEAVSTTDADRDGMDGDVSKDIDSVSDCSEFNAEANSTIICTLLFDGGRIDAVRC